MAEQEFYRLDLVIGTQGIDQAEKRLKSMDRFLDSTKRRAATIDRVRASPSVRLNDQFTRPSERVTSKLKELTVRKWNVTLGLIDQASGAAGTIVRRIRSTVSGALSSAVSLPAVVGGSAAVYGGAIAPLKMASDMEQANIAFTTMLKSGEKAKNFISELQDFAERTPFDFAGLRDASQRMLAFKFQQSEIIPKLTTIGDWAGAMGKGKEGIDRIVLAFGQMKAKGRVQGDEMLQLTEAGINGYDYLSKAIGVSTAQVMKLQEKGLIPANQAIEAIVKGMNEDFGGSMKLQEKTLFGLWNRMKETFSNKLVLRWGEGLAKGIKPKLEQIDSWLDRNGDTVTRWGEKFFDISSSAASGLVKGFDEVFSYVNRHYIQNPDFQKLDVKGKISFVIDDVYKEFLGWYDGGGSKQITDISSKLVNNIADSIAANAAPITDAGLKLGGTLASGIVEGLGKNLKEVNKKAFEEPNAENVTKATVVNIAATALAAYVGNKVFKPFKSVGKLFNRGKPITGAATEIVTSTAGNAAASSTAQQLTKKFPKSPYDPGWSPRYTTPVKPDVALPKKFMPGIPTAGNFIRNMIAPQFLLPQLAGTYISNNIREGQAKQRAAYMERFADDEYMLEQAKKPIWQRSLASPGYTQSKVSAPEPSVKISDDQIDQLTGHLKNLKQETKNQYSFSMSPGAVQVQVKQNEMEETKLMEVVGVPFIKNIIKIFENRPK